MEGLGAGVVVVGLDGGIEDGRLEGVGPGARYVLTGLTGLLPLPANNPMPP